MAEHRWSILCHRACIDKNSNLLSILDVTEAITIEVIKEPLPDNPALDIKRQLVSMWVRSELTQPEVFWSKFTITAPNGEEFDAADANRFEGGGTLKGTLDKHLTRTRLIVQIGAIPFRGVGTYWFNVEVAESPEGPYKVAARVPLEISFKDGAAASAIAPQPPSEPPPAAPRASSSRRGRRRP